MKQNNKATTSEPFIVDNPFSYSTWLKMRDYALALLDNLETKKKPIMFCISILSTKAREELAEQFADQLPQRLKKSALNDFYESIDEEDDFSIRLVERSYKIKKTSGGRLILKKVLRHILAEYSTEESFLQGEEIDEKLSYLAELFDLNENEKSVTCFLHCVHQSPRLKELCEADNLHSFYSIIAAATGISHGKIYKLLSKDSKLVQSGIVSEINRDSPSAEFSEDIDDYLAGLSGNVPLIDKFIMEATGRFPIESFSIPQETVTLIKGLLTSSAHCNILLYGEQGTGKTEFAKTISHECGKKAFFVQYGKDGKIAERKLALQASIGTVQNKGIIIVDEADQFLNTEYMFFSDKETIDKGWLNNFLDKTKAKIIWITNHIECIEDSVRRRFSYSWRFKPFTRKDREQVFHVHIKDHPLQQHMTKEMIRDLATRYKVNASGIGQSLEVATAILNNTECSRVTIKNLMAELLLRQQELIHGRSETASMPLSSQYDIEALNIDVNTAMLLATLQGFTSYSLNKTTKDPCNMNLLFWGRPGTGKTEFAKYLAAELSMDLLIKRASDLLNCYVGETEASIRDAFDEARRQKALLFIDEADSFFTARESARHSWEITQTNELLTQMENHTGILICCTNLLHNLDRAAMRRFAWKIEFKPLTKKGKLTLYHKYFYRGDSNLTEQQQRCLTEIPNLTAGDFKTVWLKHRFYPPDKLDHDFIIKALLHDSRYKTASVSEKIGF